MTDKKDHIVHKLSLELHAPSDEYARSLPDASRRAVDGLTEQLDEKFGNTFFQIEKLSVELDLYGAEISDFEKQLKKALSKELNSIELLDFESGEQEKRQEAIVARSAEDHQKALVMHFLRTGRLPWWGSSTGIDEMEHWLKKVSAAEWTETMRKEHMPAILFQRLAMQFPDMLVDSLLEKTASSPNSYSKIKMVLNELEKFSQKILSGGIESTFIAILKGKILQALCSADVAIEKYLLKEALTDLMGKAARNREGLSVAELEESWKRWLQKSNSRYTNFWLNKTEEVSADLSTLRKSEFQKYNKPAAKNEGSFGKDQDEVAIHFAGLVLLHPFITNLFQNVGLLRKGGFVDAAAQQRAVCLLYYLAAGEVEFFEPALSLPKFLCSWPANKPVNRFLSLSQFEKKECDTLLEQAISHWEVMKNTSVQTIRSEFISREGILRQETFGWSLYIERQTKDILLEKLPWSLSPVKFKWMEQMLTVQW